jgi:hypothetical protein
MHKSQIEAVILAVAEIPDRDSPEDQPEMMLVSDKELRSILEERAACTLTIKPDGDEEVRYKLNDVEMITANHDDDGWAGMERIDKLMRRIAYVIGAEVVEE